MREETCDVLVIGSGAGGLATAVCAAHRGLKPIVIEKEPVFGGTSARSGGWMWLPASDVSARAGISDSAEKAREYLRHETGAFFDPARIDAFLEAVPKAVAFYETETALQFDLGAFFADYHPTAPGGMAGGRSMVARPFDGRELGKEIRRLRPPLQEITFLGMMIGSGKELLHFFNVLRSPISAIFVAKLFVKFLRDMTFHGRPMRLMNGNALVARLAKSCFDQNVPIWTSAPARKLLTADDGRIEGAIVDSVEGPVRIIARKGVVLAAGGFPHDIERRKKLFPHAPTGHEHASPAPLGNTGDGIRLAQAVGAVAEDGLPNAAAWVPISRPVRRDGTLGTFPHFVDRSKPGIIAVTRSGRRFVNESNSYHDFCQAMVARCGEEDSQGEICAFFVTDHRAFRKYGLGYAKPAPIPFGRELASGYLTRGKTLQDLARQVGIDPVQLEATVRRFNDAAARGEDPEFGKGTTAYNRSLGDPEHKPNPCLAPIVDGPFYAVKLVVGDLGTFGGLKCDDNARVLDADGRPLQGLYAVGNDAASIMGGNYPGGGITLGPAVTFAYVAARHIAGANA